MTAHDPVVVLVSRTGLALAASGGALVARPLTPHARHGWERAFQWRVSGLGTTFDPVLQFEHLDGGLLTVIDRRRGTLGLRNPVAAADDAVWNVRVIGRGALSWHWWLNALPPETLARPFDQDALFEGAGGGFAIRLNADPDRTLTILNGNLAGGGCPVVARDGWHGGAEHELWVPLWVPRSAAAAAS
ncbi:MAG TPA: hypothetical protein VMD91_10315 [Candidatus Sulfotelmatobacter sp.]|nr:hypothetical protein [Candidatus Sulfotelmatobacter sp.]